MGTERIRRTQTYISRKLVSHALIQRPPLHRTSPDYRLILHFVQLMLQALDTFGVQRARGEPEIGEFDVACAINEEVLLGRKRSGRRKVYDRNRRYNVSELIRMEVALA